MKLSHAIILIALLTSQFASLAFGSAIVNGLCQFDKSTMIKEKLKKGQECINNGNYSGAKNYLNGVLKLDSNNAKAKELLAVCNNEGKPVTSPSNSSSLILTIVIETIHIVLLFMFLKLSYLSVLMVEQSH